jgi:ectoine hydroxylase-related dioxygenase (phytanoyl-CoA dioxygenase family)
MVLFDDALEENGCFRVIRASHHRGCLPGLNDDSQLAWAFTNPNEFSENDQVPIVAPAGSVVFFNPHTVHGSQPNFSKMPRRAIIITYQPGGFPGKSKHS